MEIPSLIDNEKTFAVNNWTSDDFMCKWDGDEIVIKAGETKQFPTAIAFHITKHFVDAQMNKDGKSSLIAVHEERKVYEDKTLTQIGVKATNDFKIDEKVTESAKDEKKPKKATKKTTKKKADGEFADLKE